MYLLNNFNLLMVNFNKRFYYYFEIEIADWLLLLYEH